MQTGPGVLTPVAVSPLPFSNNGSQNTPIPRLPVVSLPKSPLSNAQQTPYFTEGPAQTPRKMVPLSSSVPLVSMQPINESNFSSPKDTLPGTADRTNSSINNQPYQTTVQYGTSAAYNGQSPSQNIQFTIPGIGTSKATGVPVQQQLSPGFPLSLPGINLPQVVGTANLPPVNLPQVIGLPPVNLPSVGSPGVAVSQVNLSTFGTLGTFIPTILADNELGDLRWNRPNPPQARMNGSRYQRVGCIGDGSCFFHAIAKGTSEIYQLSYRRFTEIKEATLKEFEHSSAGGIIFQNNLFNIPRSNNPNTVYTFVDATAANAFRILMENFRRIYVRLIRQDFANTILNNERMQSIIRYRLAGSIQSTISTIVSNEFTRLIRYQNPMISEDEITYQLGNYLSGREEFHLGRLINLANQLNQNISEAQIQNLAFQEVKNRLVQELLSGNAVQPDFMLLLSDFIDIDIYLLRDADLINSDPRNNPLYSGASLHAAVHGPVDMRPQGDIYQGLPNRRAIVIISVDDFHYEIVARVDTINNVTNEIHSNMDQEEPLIRRLYEMLANLRLAD